jgi:hypothetical protein
MSTNEKVPKKFENYSCLSCDYITVRKSQYERHLLTRKHKMLNNTNKKVPKGSEQKPYHCSCGNIYKFASSLCYHKKTCKVINIDDSSIDLASLTVPTNKVVSNELIIKLIEQNEKLQEQLISLSREKSVIHNIVNNNNNTNNFNLNLFLNEKCKDALNISDFIESLKITLEDLAYSKNKGLVEGITNVMIKGLRQLDVHKRPIHCTDAKRDTMYIKDCEKWEKDDNHEKMKNTIVKIANKERNSICKWVDQNPDWFDTEEKQIEYLTLVRNVCEPIENYEKNGRKIIRNISREVLLDKATKNS